MKLDILSWDNLLRATYRFATRDPHLPGLDYVGRRALEEAVAKAVRRKRKKRK